MAKSIIQKEKYCYLSGAQNVPLEEHHCFFGPLRKISERYGFKVWLTPEYHKGKNGPHQDRKTDLLLKRECQRKFEETHSREEFMKIIGRNYLKD